MFFDKKEKRKMIDADKALSGRSVPMIITAVHAVNQHAMKPPFDKHLEQAVFGLGCFWGAERKFWELAGVYSTAVGYSAGFTPNPTYEEVCSGSTGHNEVVLVVFDPALISYEDLLKVFWESHNPTQGMQQGNDIGTQYRSGIYTANEKQKNLAEQSAGHYQQQLDQSGHQVEKITTEILPLAEFYYAEEYHQQYLHKNPNGYCGLGGLGVCY